MPKPTKIPTTQSVIKWLRENEETRPNWTEVPGLNFNVNRVVLFGDGGGLDLLPDGSVRLSKEKE